MTAEAHVRPGEVDAVCLFGACDLGNGGKSDKHSHLSFRDWEDRHGRRNDDRDDDRDDDGEHCPTLVRVSIELPVGYDARTIGLASVRIGGTIAPLRVARGLVDTDRDHVRERSFIFRFSDLAPLLRVGVNTLRVTGKVGVQNFAADGTLVVRPLEADLKLTPETLDRSASGGNVRAIVDFDGGLRADEVEIASLRLEGVAVKRVVGVRGDEVVVEFSRALVLAAVPNGNHVPLTLSGRVRGLAFEAEDSIRVRP